MQMTRISKLVAAVFGFLKPSRHHTQAGPGTTDSGSLSWKPVQRDDLHPNPYSAFSKTNAFDLYRTAPLSEKRKVQDAIDRGQLCVGFKTLQCFEYHSGIRTNEDGPEPMFRCQSCGKYWSAPYDR